MLDLAIEHFDVVFDGSWGSAGPELLTRVLRTLCEFGPNEKFFDASVHTKERCQGVEVLRPIEFLTLPEGRAFKMMPKVC